MRVLLTGIGALALAALAAPAMAQGPNKSAPEVSVLRRSPNTLVYQAGPGGHFVVPGSANGAPVRFLVDTGATLVVLTPSDARAAGIDPGTLVFDKAMRTANSTASAATMVLREVRVGGISIGDVRAAVTGSVAIGTRHELLEPVEELRDAAGSADAVLVADEGHEVVAIGTAKLARREETRLPVLIKKMLSGEGAPS